MLCGQADCPSYGKWSTRTGGGHLTADCSEEEHHQAVSTGRKAVDVCSKQCGIDLVNHNQINDR